MGLHSLPGAFLCSLYVIDQGRGAWEEGGTVTPRNSNPGLWAPGGAVGFFMRSAVRALSGEQALGGRAGEEGEEEEDRGSAAGTH